jgi:hypothetical protein
LFRYEIQNGGYGRTFLTFDPMGKMVQNASSLKNNCPGMIIGKFSVFYSLATGYVDSYVEFFSDSLCYFMCLIKASLFVSIAM